MAQKQKTAKTLLRSELIAKTLMVISATVAVVSPLPLLAVGNYGTQITATQSAVSSYEEQQVRLAGLAKTIEEQLARLEAQLADVNTQIQENKLKFDDLSLQLKAREADVAMQSDKVEAVLRQSYLDSQVSVIEMVASRKNLSHYMDYYAARDRLQDQLLSNLDELQQAKEEVEAQRDAIAAVLRDGKAMRDTLRHKRTEQRDLLERTRGQQRAYAQLAKERNANIAELRAKQRSANQSYFVAGKLIEGDPNRGGYPNKLHNAPQDSLVDPWGMFNRECVSYTAWKVHQTTGHMPYWGGHGNANQWPASARAVDIPVGSTPKKHAVAIAFIGPYGHAMFVEEILGGGNIRVSEYNYFVNGTYTERIIPGDGLTYIYFK